jgi:cytochrome P450
MNRDSSVFGDDIKSVNPNRWNSICPVSWQHLPFGGCQGHCLSQQKVLVEVAYTLVRMAARFESLETENDRPWDGDVKLACENANECQGCFALYCGVKRIE